MRINLLEIPDEGREYDFSEKTAELNAVLHDLIGDRPYRVKLFIKPLSSIFEISGNISSHLPLTCVNCAEDFEWPVLAEFRELLFVSTAPERVDKGAKVNHLSDLNGSESHCTLLDSPHVDLGEFVHEQIAFSEPPHPQGCKTLSREECENYKRFQDQLKKKEEGSFEDHPFSVLKNFKLEN